MIVGRKYENNDIIYTVFKKHNCPECGSKLSRKKASKIVNSQSPESKDYDLSLGDSFMSGDLEFIWKEFYCPVCKKRIPIDEIRRMEKEQKER